MKWAYNQCSLLFCAMYILLRCRQPVVKGSTPYVQTDRMFFKVLSDNSASSSCMRDCQQQNPLKRHAKQRRRQSKPHPQESQVVLHRPQRELQRLGRRSLRTRVSLRRGADTRAPDRHREAAEPSQSAMTRVALPRRGRRVGNTFSFIIINGSSWATTNIF